MLSEYPRPMVTVDVVILTFRDRDLQVLLIRRKHPPFEGMWAIPGGFVDIDEPLERAALRELEEETGVRDVRLEQLYTFGDPGRDPRGRTITVAYLALLPAHRTTVQAGDDAADARWWPLRSLPPLAFDHDRILDCALRKLRRDLRCMLPLPELLPETFTLDELREVHEAVLGERLEPRRFRRKALSSGVLERTGGFRRERGQRRALYRFRLEGLVGLPHLPLLGYNPG